MARVDSIPHRLLEHARQRPEHCAYATRGSSTWSMVSYRTYGAQMREVGRALIALGIEEGDFIAILGFNRPEWVLSSVGAMAVGGAAAGIYTTSSAEEVAYILGHAPARLVVVEDHAQWEKVKGKLSSLSALRAVVLMEGAAPIDDPIVHTWREFLALANRATDRDLDDRLARIRPEGVATLIYTSGTTGPPKAVMLTHENLVWTADTASRITNAGPEDRSLSYLPLSHIAEQMFSIHVPISRGMSVYFARSMEKLPDDLKEVHPTVFFGVPRVWEKVYDAMQARLAGASSLRKRLATTASAVGLAVAHAQSNGGRPPLSIRLAHRVTDRLVGAKVRAALGLDKARFLVSGAAPIGKEILEFFAGFGLVIQEVYGQSEDCGPTTINLRDRFRFGTVGLHIPGIEVRIADDGEILVRGPNVFAGYLHDPDATAAILRDGWLHSGDLGAFDADGFLTITGRKKDIIITSGGKNIAPKNIESAIKLHPRVGEAVVVGDRRKYVAALISLDAQAAAAWAKDLGVAIEALADTPAVREDLQRHLDGVNATLANVEQVKRFVVLARPLSLEAGELTPTLKVKRNVVLDRYARVIDAMYAD